MPKKLCAFRLSQKTLSTINKLQTLTGKPKVGIVEFALELYLVVEISNKNRLYNDSADCYTVKNPQEGL